MLIDFHLRKGKGERKRERNNTQLPPVGASTGDRTCNLGMCPDKELNLWPFGVWYDTPTNWTTPVRDNSMSFNTDSCNTHHNQDTEQF